jgi:UvrD/REP helicase N-terminal domain
LFARLREDGFLPVRSSNLQEAQQRLDAVIAEVAARSKDNLAPAIDRVWEDGVAAIRADLREWLRRASEDESGYVPWSFELSFGLEHRPERRQADPQSTPGAVGLLLLLAADDPKETEWRAVRPIPGKLFLVGDPKQSIYRFRRAEVALYEEVKERLRHVGTEVLHLTTSFRSPPSIQSFVNLAFAPAMAAVKDGGQATYIPLEPSRPEIISRPTLVALPVPKPYGDFGKIVNRCIDESLPEAVGAFIAWLVKESGWTVEESRGTVPIRPHHVAILGTKLVDVASQGGQQQGSAGVGHRTTGGGKRLLQQIHGPLLARSPLTAAVAQAGSPGPTSAR